MFTLLVSAKQTRSLLRFFFALGPESKVVCAWQWGRYMWKCMILPTLQMLRMFGMIIISVWFLGIQSWPIPKEYDPNDSLKSTRVAAKQLAIPFQPFSDFNSLPIYDTTSGKPQGMPACLASISTNLHIYIESTYAFPIINHPTIGTPMETTPLQYSLQMVKFLRSKHGLNSGQHTLSDRRSNDLRRQSRQPCLGLAENSEAQPSWGAQRRCPFSSGTLCCPSFGHVGHSVMKNTRTFNGMFGVELWALSIGALLATATSTDSKLIQSVTTIKWHHLIQKCPLSLHTLHEGKIQVEYNCKATRLAVHSRTARKMLNQGSRSSSCTW